MDSMVSECLMMPEMTAIMLYFTPSINKDIA